MWTCIYCLESKPATGFRKREHVLPQSFGRFRPTNLTLHTVVCDECNQLFGDTIDRYLARDTPDGLRRYLVGGRNPKEFKPPRKTSSVEVRIKSGFLKGAFAVHRPGGGPRDFAPVPQIGFGTSKDGPFEWFKQSQLPTPEQFQRLSRDGFHHVYFCEIADPDPVLAQLEGPDVNVSDVIAATTVEPSEQRFEWAASPGMEFGRAITKIAFNYLAHQYGTRTALMAEFNTARSFVRYGGKPDGPRIWNQLPPRTGTRPLGHSIAIEWNPRGRSAAAGISFHNAERHRITLATDLLVVPTDNRAHFFDLKSMTVRQIR